MSVVPPAAKGTTIVTCDCNSDPLNQKVKTSIGDTLPHSAPYWLITGKNDFNDTPYFVNGHHAKRFEKSFPNLWHMMSHGAQRPADVEREANLLRGRAPTTYKSLTTLGIL